MRQEEKSLRGMTLAELWSAYRHEAQSVGYSLNDYSRELDRRANTFQSWAIVALTIVSALSTAVSAYLDWVHGSP